MTDSSELQGELAALRCFAAAIASTLPPGAQMKLWPSFEAHSELVRDGLCEEALSGFERASVSLRARRQI